MAMRSASWMRGQVENVGQGSAMSPNTFESETFDKAPGLGIAWNARGLKAKILANRMNAPADGAMRSAGGAAVEGKNGEQVEQIVFEVNVEFLGGNPRALFRQVALDEAGGALGREHIQVAAADFLFRRFRI
jgi:hypothetical protein